MINRWHKQQVAYRRPIQIWIARCILFSILGGGNVCAQRTTDGTVVKVTMRENVTLSKPLVIVGDVADVTGGNIALRRKVSNIDIDYIDAAPSEIEVRRSQVELRLQLANVSDSQVAVQGPKATLVRRQHEMLDDNTVLQGLRVPLASTWGIPEDVLRLRLDKPLARVVPTDLTLSPDLRFAPFIPANVFPGKLRFTIGVYRKDQLQDTFVVPISVQVEQAAAVARRPLKIGDEITVDDITFQRQRRIGPESVITLGTDCIGKFVVRGVRTNGLVTIKHVSSTKPTTIAVAPPSKKELPQQVRSRSPVILVAQRGAMKVIVRSAELVTSARVGEYVRVKNLDSNRIVNGKLVSPTEVEVKF